MSDLSPGTDSLSFSDSARKAAGAEWIAACNHPFTVALGDAALPKEAMAAYLVQDYAFVETLVSMVGYAVGKAPNMPAMARLSNFLAAVTSDENTYFQRSFEALGVAPADYTAPPLHPVTRQFLEAMANVGRNGTYGEIMATLLPAEWIYLTWGEAQAAKAPEPFYFGEWVTLHANPDFRAFVMWLKDETDRAAAKSDQAGREAMSKRFAEMVRLEVAFFDVFCSP